MAHLKRANDGLPGGMPAAGSYTSEAKTDGSESLSDAKANPF
jgi:hypothetical protein